MDHQRCHINDLPDTRVLDILLRLRWKDIGRVAAVQRRWQRLLVSGTQKLALRHTSDVCTMKVELNPGDSSLAYLWESPRCDFRVPVSRLVPHFATLQNTRAFSLKMQFSTRPSGMRMFGELMQVLGAPSALPALRQSACEETKKLVHCVRAIGALPALERLAFEVCLSTPKSPRLGLIADALPSLTRVTQLRVSTEDEHPADAHATGRAMRKLLAQLPSLRDIDACHCFSPDVVSARRGTPPWRIIGRAIAALPALRSVKLQTHLMPPDEFPEPESESEEDAWYDGWRDSDSKRGGPGSDDGEASDSDDGERDVGYYEPLPATLRELAALTGLTRLHVVVFRNRRDCDPYDEPVFWESDVQNAAGRIVAGCKHLSTFVLECMACRRGVAMQLESDLLESLKKCTSLRRLSLLDVNIPDYYGKDEAAWPKAMRAMPQLEHLILKVTPPFDLVWAGLKHLPALRHLEVTQVVEGFSVMEEDDEPLEGADLANLQALTTLHICVDNLYRLERAQGDGIKAVVRALPQLVSVRMPGLSL